MIVILSGGEEQAGGFMLFLVMALIVGAAIKHAVSFLKIPLPYTVLLLIAGFGAGAANSPVDETPLGEFSKSINKFG